MKKKKDINDKNTTISTVYYNNKLLKNKLLKNMSTREEINPKV